MENPAERSRGMGIVLIATGIAAIALLLNHPSEQARDFAGLLKEEAANQLVDGIVHGGFVIVLTLQLGCYAALSARLGWRAFAVMGLAFFAVGALTQMASVTIDGLVLPQLAARYLPAPANTLPYARSLLVLCTTVIQFLMPMGMVFQGAGVACWGAQLSGVSRGAGGIGLIMGLAIMGLVAGAVVTDMQHLLMLAIAVLALWALIAGVLMVQRKV